MRTQEFLLWEPVTENFMMRRNFVVNMSSVDGLLLFKVQMSGGCVSYRLWNLSGMEVNSGAIREEIT